MKKALYICVGGNWCDDCRLGYCGDIHTLEKWIEVLFASKAEQARNYFNGAGDKEVVEYLFKWKGKEKDD